MTDAFCGAAEWCSKSGSKSGLHKMQSNIKGAVLAHYDLMRKNIIYAASAKYNNDIYIFFLSVKYNNDIYFFS